MGMSDFTNNKVDDAKDFNSWANIDSSDNFNMLNTDFNNSSILQNDKNNKDAFENNTLDINEVSLSNECTALVTIKERHLLSVQNVFKKSIRVSLKAFLISLSLSFLNFFI